MAKEIYDENIYLNGGEEAFGCFNEKRYLMHLYYALEKRDYGNILSEYDKLIQRTIELLKTLGFKNPFEYSISIWYLIFEGYLSRGNKFTFGDPVCTMESKPGVNIVTNIGKCHNLSGLHTDVFEGLEMYDKRLICGTNKSIKKAQKGQANHVINIVDYNGTLCGIDLSNNCLISRFESPLILKGIDDSVMLAHKPYFSYILGDMDYEGIMSFLECLELQVGKPLMTVDEYWNDIMEPTIVKCILNEDLFKDFSNETKDIKENIWEGMELKRKIAPTIDKMEIV